jgi:protein gp37
MDIIELRKKGIWWNATGGWWEGCPKNNRPGCGGYKLHGEEVCWAQLHLSRNLQHERPDHDPHRLIMHTERLGQIAHWRDPRLVFVCPRGDFFDGRVAPIPRFDAWISMLDNPEHTFIIPTKNLADSERFFRYVIVKRAGEPSNIQVWASCWDQESVDAAAPVLAALPVPVKGLMLEPLLGPVDLSKWMQPIYAGVGLSHFQGVCVGGQTGTLARPMHFTWVRSLRDQCAAVSVPFFFKGWGEWSPITVPPFRNWKRYEWHEADFPTVSFLVGRQRSGRKLDGCTYDEWPGRQLQWSR